MNIRTENRPLVTLAVAHLLCGPILGYFTEDGPETILLAVYIGLVFSQTSLVGIWGGLATCRWPIRLAGVTIGVAYLGPQFCFSLDEWDFEIVLLVILPTLAVYAVFLVVRRLMARLENSATTTASENAEGLQFSIRHLMLLTFAVACTLTIGKWLKPMFDAADHLAVVAVLTLCFVSVGVASAWAMLGRAYLVLRSCAVLFLGFSTAYIPTGFMGEGDFWFWSIIMTVEAMCLLGSLFVVRRCGFRLVRISYNQ